MSEFGYKLKCLREDRGMSVSSLSELTGIARRTIYDWEKGKYLPPTFSTREILANVFGVDPFFFDGDFGLSQHPVIKSIIKRLEKLEDAQKLKDEKGEKNEGNRSL